MITYVNKKTKAISKIVLSEFVVSYHYLTVKAR
jgi:hypothetical protein